MQSPLPNSNKNKSKVAPASVSERVLRSQTRGIQCQKVTGAKKGEEAEEEDSAKEKSEEKKISSKEDVTPIPATAAHRFSAGERRRRVSDSQVPSTRTSAAVDDDTFCVPTGLRGSRRYHYQFTVKKGTELPLYPSIDTIVDGAVLPPPSEFDGQCYFCHGSNHSQHYCPMQKCSSCNEYGHSHQKCPMRRQGEYFPPQYTFANTQTRKNAQAGTFYRDRQRSRYHAFFGRDGGNSSSSNSGGGNGSGGNARGRFSFTRRARSISPWQRHPTSPPSSLPLEEDDYPQDARPTTTPTTTAPATSIPPHRHSMDATLERLIGK